MTEFINLWKNYVNFSDRTTRKGYWMALLFWFIIYIVLIVLMTIVQALAILLGLFALASIVPLIAAQVRRLRDAGKEWWWMFIPVANLIFTIMPSVPDDGTPQV